MKMENEMTLFELIDENQKQGYDGFTNHDVAVLADWAGEEKNKVANSDWKRAYALIREGADLLLRRRARSSQTPDYLSLRKQLNDYASTFYGPHECEFCRATIVRRAVEQGGERYEQRADATPEWALHRCDPDKIAAQPRPAPVNIPVNLPPTSSASGVIGPITVNT